MTSTAFSLRGTYHANARPPLAQRILTVGLAVGDVEWEAIKGDRRTVRELWFHALALIVCPTWFGVTVYRVAIDLFEYGILAAVVLSAAAAGGLLLVDQHYLIQRRGTPEGLKGGVNKVRFATLVVLTISSALMATSAFEKDIQRVLSKERSELRAQLEQSLNFKVELEAARAAVSSTNQAAQRAGALDIEIGQRELELSETLEEYRNQVEGNTTGERSRTEGRGKIARGLEAKEKRLIKQLEALQRQLDQAQGLAAQLPAARARLAHVDAQIDKETAELVGGPLKRLKVLMSLVRADLAACVFVFFWVALGFILDLPIWLAQARSANHETLAAARKLELEVRNAYMAHMRRELRDLQAEARSPIEVRLGSER